jgi:hypothetical protein
MAITPSPTQAIPGQSTISPQQQKVIDATIQGQEAPTNLPITAVSDRATAPVNPREAAQAEATKKDQNTAQMKLSQTVNPKDSRYMMDGSVNPNYSPTADWPGWAKDFLNATQSIKGGPGVGGAGGGGFGGNTVPGSTAQTTVPGTSTMTNVPGSADNPQGFDVLAGGIHQSPSPILKNETASPIAGTSVIPKASQKLEDLHQKLNAMNNPNFLANYNIQPDLLDALGVAFQHGGKNFGATTRYQQGLTQALESQKAANAEYAKNLGETANVQNAAIMDVAKAEEILPQQVKAEIEKATGIAWGTLDPEIKKIMAQRYVELSNMPMNLLTAVNPAMRGYLGGIQK